MSIDYLKNVASEDGDRCVLLISDAEKMGVWGTTHEICYVEGHGHQEGDSGKPFIPAFFEQIINNTWIKSFTLSEYIHNYRAKSLIYLPTASYDKMEEWVLPTEIRKRFKLIRESLKNNQKETYQFLRGGFWRYFLVKYPESNNMHKKMIYVRNKLLNIEENLEKIQNEQYTSIISNKIKEAWDEIYKSQCNDCYWHGLFGGVYLQFLRFSVYTHLIKAEKIIDEINILLNPKLKSYIYITPIDFIKDSKTEYLIESDILNVYLSPSDGGSIFELDYKPKSYNLLNTLTRWPEAYHDDEKLKSKEILVDRFRRSLLRLRIFHDDVTLEQLHADDYYEFGDFINNSFRVTSGEKEGKIAIIEMEKLGSIKDTDSNLRYPVRITKDINVVDNEIRVIIRINFDEIPGKKKMLKRILTNLNLGIDIPFFFNGNPEKFSWSSEQTDLKENKITSLLTPFQYNGTNFKAYDEKYDINFQFDISTNKKSGKIYKFPIIAYVFTDEGYKEIYQGINVIPSFRLNKNLEIHLKVKIF
jgi:alpha-amylase